MRVRANLLGAPAMSTCTASRVVPYELHMTRTENTKVHTGSMRNQYEMPSSSSHRSEKAQMSAPN